MKLKLKLSRFRGVLLSLGENHQGTEGARLGDAPTPRPTPLIEQPTFEDAARVDLVAPVASTRKLARTPGICY